ncbi:MAG: tetratricopeptide repeat-containing glycosyltransferase family protein [Tepidisphaeraceae bacterium]
MDQQTLQSAVQLHQAGRLDEAERGYRQVLARNPRQADALHLLGVVHSQRGRHQEAIHLIRQAIALRPGIAVFHASLGGVYRTIDRSDLAAAEYRQAAKFDPGNFDYFHEFGATLAESDRADEAIAAFTRTIELNPTVASAYSNKGALLREKGRLEEAGSCFSRAIELDPKFPGSHNNLAILLYQEGKIDEAITAWRQAIALQPDFATAHLNLSHALLKVGQFTEGWEEFEWRLRNPRADKDPRRARPQWDGSDPSGKTILFHAEGGNGDTLQFVRLVPPVAQRGAKLILECQPGLIPLLEAMPGIDRIIPHGHPLPEFDLQITLQGLPRVLGITLQNIPSDVPYVTPPADRVKRWADRLAGESKLRVGLFWAGSRTVKESQDVRTRSIDVFAPLAAVKGVKFFSLQKGEAAGQSPPIGMDWADFTSEINDFADTAALVQNLDLVFSIDSSVAHLAGALAKPVWVLLPFHCDYRWLIDRGDSPWYPTMRLFRQSAANDWAAPVARMAQALRDLALRDGQLP